MSMTAAKQLGTLHAVVSAILARAREAGVGSAETLARAELDRKGELSLEQFVEELESISNKADEPWKLWMKALGRALLFLGNVMNMPPPPRHAPLRQTTHKDLRQPRQMTPASPLKSLSLPPFATPLVPKRKRQDLEFKAPSKETSVKVEAESSSRPTKKRKAGKLFETEQSQHCANVEQSQEAKSSRRHRSRFQIRLSSNQSRLAAKLQLLSSFVCRRSLLGNSKSICESQRRPRFRSPSTMVTPKMCMLL